ncbi:MAG: hypothetical protein GF384_02095, partial [Elusimicrobia bacterium]|nr:hypothetical protein [Elusimicrobiota bacterium]
MKIIKILYKAILNVFYIIFSKKAIATLVCASLVVSSIPLEAFAKDNLTPAGVSETTLNISFGYTSDQKQPVTKDGLTPVPGLSSKKVVPKALRAFWRPLTLLMLILPIAAPSCNSIIPDDVSIIVDPVSGGGLEYYGYTPQYEKEHVDPNGIYKEFGGIVFTPTTGRLLLVDDTEDAIVETSLDGTIQRII